MWTHSLFILAVSILPVLTFHYFNEYKRVERWYYRNHKPLYLALQVSYFLLVLSIALHGRYVVYTGIEHFVKTRYGIKMELYPYR